MATAELEVFEECPNCALGDDRWVYLCTTCGFTGCWDEVYDNGCFELSLESGELVCPDCGETEKEKVGLVGAGTSEE